MRSLKILILLLIPCLHAAGQGQPSPYASRIGTILQQMPSPNDSLYNISMKQMEKLGENGLTAMAVMVQTKDPRVAYAINGYTGYITGALMDSARKIAVNAYCKALKQVTTVAARSFLIGQLQLCGNDIAAAAIAPYLIQESLCDAATRALIQIDGPVAKPLLVYALAKAKGNCKISLINALGELRYLSALDAITTLADTKDVRQRRAALMAIANIASEDSDSILNAAAKKVNYAYDSAGATAAYILYAQRLLDNWPQEPARVIASRLLVACKQPSQIAVRVAALQILVTVRYHDANRLLGDAASDPDPAYRAAALTFAAKNMNNANTAYWIDRVGREKGTVKAGILLLLGGSRQRATTNVIQTALGDTNLVVKTAAIKAAGLLGNTTLIASLVFEMGTADSTTIFLIKDVLLTMRSKMVASTASVQINNKPPLAQVALLQIIAEKKAVDAKFRVEALLKSKHEVVREQAAKTLAIIQGT